MSDKTILKVLICILDGILVIVKDSKDEELKQAYYKYAKSTRKCVDDLLQKVQ